MLLDGVVTVVVPSKLRSDGGPVRALRVAVGRGHIGMHRTLRRRICGILVPWTRESENELELDVVASTASTASHLDAAIMIR